MKKTIVLLGVGSTYFTRGIVESLITKGGEWEVRLVDIDPKCLDIAVRLSERLVQAYDAPVTVKGSPDRLEVLSGADAVVSTIGVGGRRAWEKDVIVPRRFGIYQSTGDTFGAGGVSRALRMIPIMVAVAKDIERLCPQALLINFSNPMTVNCRAMVKAASIKIAGLCYGVTFWQHYLSRLIGAPFEEVTCRAIGVNHFTWITELRYEGKDAWPLVRAKIREKPDEERHHPYTWELFRIFDAFPCVGDGHICEFIPGWQGKDAYYGKTFGLDGGHDFEAYAAGFDQVFQEMEDQAHGRTPILKRIDDPPNAATFRDEDLFIDVLNASMGEDEIFRTVNLPNNGQARNLPAGAVLEATTRINGDGFQPQCFGELPPGIAAILQRIIGVQELTVEAALSADRKLVLQALVAGETVRTEAEAQALADALLETHREWLPQFFN